MEIEDTIKKILVSDVFLEVPFEQIDIDASLRNTYGLDSLGFVELRVQCEDQFDVRISDDDFASENFRSVADLAALIRRLRAE